MKLYALNEILNNGKPTLEWIHEFMKNTEFCNYRFKYYCEKGNRLEPNFDFISEWIDIVDNVDEFNAIEKNRIPLFLGSEPELLPAVLSDEGLRLKSPIIAILVNTIITSNKVLGLGFYSIKPRRSNEKSYRRRRELVFFNNPEYHEIKTIETIKKVYIDHFKSEITIGLEEGYTQKPIDKSEVIGFLQKFQDNLIEKGDIYLSAKVTDCDIVMSGQVEPHLTISFINHPKYPMTIDNLKGIVGHLAMDLMERFKQNRIVVMHSDETVMYEKNNQMDGR
jgi:hypothetical protein